MKILRTVQNVMAASAALTQEGKSRSGEPVMEGQLNTGASTSATLTQDRQESITMVDQ